MYWLASMSFFEARAPEANVPVFVLEYLLGKYCASTDPQVIEEALVLVVKVNA